MDTPEPFLGARRAIRGDVELGDNDRRRELPIAGQLSQPAGKTRVRTAAERLRQSVGIEKITTPSGLELGYFAGRSSSSHHTIDLVRQLVAVIPAAQQARKSLLRRCRAKPVQVLQLSGTDECRHWLAIARDLDDVARLH